MPMCIVALHVLSQRCSVIRTLLCIIVWLGEGSGVAANPMHRGVNAMCNAMCIRWPCMVLSEWCSVIRTLLCIIVWLVRSGRTVLDVMMMMMILVAPCPAQCSDAG